MDRLVLWDIDHTLIDGGGVSREAYAVAFARFTGRPFRQLADMAGKTELRIAADTLRLHGIDPEGPVLRGFIEAVADELEARADALAAAGRVLPGVVAALEALAAVRGVYQTVLTGNMRRLAELKLSVFGLDGWIEWEGGAYGDDAAERVELLPYAWERAARHWGRSFHAARTVLVGDTVLDVATGQAGGAAVIAVATGSTSAQSLTQAGADVVLPDLADTGSVVRAVFACTGGVGVDQLG